TFRIRIEQGGFPSLTVDDNDPMDADPTIGKIAIVGKTVGTFTIYQAVDESKPVNADPSDARMDLTSFVVEGKGSGTLTMTLADTDFTNPSVGLTLKGSVGGTLSGNGSLTFTSGANASNISPLATPITTIPAGTTTGVMGPFNTLSYSRCI